MTHSESIAKLASALAKAQGEIETATKDAKNPHFNSKYAGLSSIMDACRGPLAKHEIAVLQSSSADGNLVRMTTLLVHSSGEWVESDPLQVQARDAAPQAIGSCLTYLRRYQLAGMAGIVPADDDAETAEGRPTAHVGPEAKTPPIPKPAPKPHAVTSRQPLTTSRPILNSTVGPEPPPLTDDDIPFNRARG